MILTGSKKLSINFHPMLSLSMNINPILNLKWPIFTPLPTLSVLSSLLHSSSGLPVWEMSKKDRVECPDSMIFSTKKLSKLSTIAKLDLMMLPDWIKVKFKSNNLLISLKIHKNTKNLVPEYQKESYYQDLLERVKQC